MQILINNWGLILGGFILVLVVGKLTYDFFKEPREEQISNIKEWMLWAVIEAEKLLGGGTGAIKLRWVYDKALERFPWIISIVSFEVFSDWVDEALENMKKELAINKSIKSFVSGNKL